MYFRLQVLFHYFFTANCRSAAIVIYYQDYSVLLSNVKQFRYIAVFFSSEDHEVGWGIGAARAVVSPLLQKYNWAERQNSRCTGGAYTLTYERWTMTKNTGLQRMAFLRKVIHTKKRPLVLVQWMQFVAVVWIVGTYATHWGGESFTPASL